MKASNILYTSALTIALGVAAPFAFAGSHDKQDSDAGYHQMDKDKKEHKEYKDRDDSQTGNPGAPGTTGTGTTGAGSDAPAAPSHVPGGTNPDAAPDSNRSVE